MLDCMRRLLTVLALVFPACAETSTGLRIIASTYDHTTGNISADLLNASDKAVIAAWIRVDTAGAGGSRQLDYFFDQIWGIGLHNLQRRFAPQFPLPADVKLGAIEPGSTFRWSQSFTPAPATALATVTAVIFVGGGGIGDKRFIDQTRRDHAAMAQEWKRWADAMTSARDLKDIRTRAGREAGHRAVLQSVEDTLSGISQSIEAGIFTESEAVAYATEYFRMMARVTSSEGAQQ